MMFKELKQTVGKLSEQEAKSVLFNILLTIDMHQESENSKEEFYQQMADICEDLKKVRSCPKRSRAVKAVHIAFGRATAGSLKMMLKESGKEQEESTIAFPEIFSIGPLRRLDSKKGRLKRLEWLKARLNDFFDELEEEYHYFEKEIAALNSISDHVRVIIWAGENAYEQTGLRFVHQLLHKKPNDIFHIHTSKAFPYIIHSGELSDEKLRLIYEKGHHKSSVTAEERLSLAEEWKALSQEDSVLRIWEDRRIKSVEETFYDSFIIEKAKQLQRSRSKKDFIVCPRVIGEVLGHLDDRIGDEFIEYRIRTLIYKGVFEIKGVPKAMRYYSVRLK